MKNLKRFLGITEERVIAFKILEKVLEEDSFLLPQIIYHSLNLEPKKRKFLQKLCFETLKNLIYIDHIIKNFYSGKFKKLEPSVRTILRASLTELIILKRKPYAVCDSWTEIAKKENFAASKLVNGILRNVLRRGPPDSKEPWINFSIPKWLYKKLKRDFGENFALNFCKWFHSDPPYYFRVCFNNNEEEIRKIIEEKYKEKGFFLSKLSFPPYAYKSFYHPWEVGLDENLYYVQDFSSQSVMHYKDFEKGIYLWDMTSAPGGKSLYLSFILKNDVKILASELRKKRAKILKENFLKYRINGYVINTDATLFFPKKEFDLVIIDAPCSGLGTIRKKPEILLRMNLEKINELRKLQEKLIDNAYNALKKGGYLFYITCTILKEENEEQIKKALEKYNFEIIEPRVPFFLIKDKYFFCNGIEMDSDFMFASMLKKI
ncbi:MAG: transcription antitermination factor NusB [candidate division WOR-3 bacterium]